MTTPDGISDDDWQVVHELAVDIVNACGEREIELRRRMLMYLDDLQAKYGELPSILATRADYVDEEDTATRLDLLTRAYLEATRRGDVRNQLYSAASVAGIFVRDLSDSNKGRHWLGVATELLTRAGDASDVDELNELAKRLEELESAE